MSVCVCIERLGKREGGEEKDKGEVAYNTHARTQNPKTTKQTGDTDKNISHIVERYETSKCFVASAGAECFLKFCRQKSMIKYKAGGSNFETIEDIEDDIDFRK